MAVTGTLICESLAPNADLTAELTIHRLYRSAVESPAPGQPAVWTLLDFTCPEAAITAVAEQLAAHLLPGLWYVDAHSEAWKYVVFAGRVFVFARTDTAASLAAVAYGRSVGVPESQLDWPL